MNIIDLRESISQPQEGAKKIAVGFYHPRRTAIYVEDVSSGNGNSQ